MTHMVQEAEIDKRKVTNLLEGDSGWWELDNFPLPSPTFICWLENEGKS